ncbi:MAG: sigma-54-dependent Fis family transcriptional regulator [Saprospiraceae bacterium]|nr:sigma-54-dependent Fis family transcriptional regulator [Saprospiraceae bacterium]MCB9319982.1 sigma-54-dependent Fis family transcriptional regulator [Lewinellaceae bacterium]
MAETSLQSVKQRFGIIGRSALLDRALSTAIRVANTDLTVLINGESGVGKEVFSKIIHGLSNRKHAPFIAVNCGAIPEGTINSELFGHEKGAFTGATGDRKGYFETVHGGTIFLDEVGEMPLDTQAYLLRILETGEYIRVGSSKVQKTDVRVIAATNVDLLVRIKEGKFREDLYYRLNTVPIYVPALRERREDIYMLFRKFAHDFGEKYRTSSIVLTDDAVQILENYSWPGNIRELKNLAEQLSVLTDQNEIDAETLAHFFPQFLKRNLPVQHIDASKENLSEREILYKLLFDMKSDLTDLKQLVFGLISTNNLDMPEYEVGSMSPPLIEAQKPFPESRPHDDRPIILSDSARDTYAKTEVVEENLSIEEMEKELILKALRKHQGKRKYAAQELGISERTLYRKINQYHLD